MIYETNFDIAKIKVFILVYQSVQVSKCENCGKVIAEQKNFKYSLSAYESVEG